MTEEDQSRYADEDTLAYIAKLEQQLAACQSDNLRLRDVLKDAIETIESLDGYDNSCNPLTGCEDEKAALSTPLGDQSALREVIARVLDEWGGDNDLGLDEAVSALRSGEWTPEALK